MKFSLTNSEKSKATDTPITNEDSDKILPNHQYQKRVIVIQAAEDEIAPDVEDSTQLNSQETPLHDPSVQPASRRLARGFTITVSPPISDFTQPSLEPIEVIAGAKAAFQHCSSVTSVDSSPTTGTQNKDGMLPRRRALVHDSDDYLVPDERLPSVGLDHTVSRLPSLEDILNDEELSKSFRSSPILDNIRDMLKVDCDRTKYENLMSLVRQSYENPEWRSMAASERSLIDNLILLIRQRLTSARNPHQMPGSDFMPKSSSSFYTSSSRSLCTSSAASSLDSTHDKQMTTGFSSDELLSKSAMHVAVLSAVVKLLRNLCVDSKDCQLYIHNHRILDLLVEHIDMIMEITYRQCDSLDGEPVQRHVGSMTLSQQDHYKCPEWAADECRSFTRALFQLIINVATGHTHIQTHILNCLFPGNLLNAIILSNDSSIIFSLLHCLMSRQKTHRLLHLLATDPGGLRAFYLLMAVTTSEQLKNADSRNPETLDTAIGFLNNVIFRKADDESPSDFSIVNELILKFKELDPSCYISSASDTLKHAVSLKSPPGLMGVLASRRNSLEVPEEWAEFVRKKVQALIAIPQQEVFDTLIRILCAVLERNVDPDPMFEICIESPIAPLDLFFTGHCFLTLSYYLVAHLQPEIDDHIFKSKDTLLAKTHMHSPPISPHPFEDIGILTAIMNSMCMSLPLDSNETNVELELHPTADNYLRLMIYMYLYRSQQISTEQQEHQPSDEYLIRNARYALAKYIVTCSNQDYLFSAVILMYILSLDKSQKMLLDKIPAQFLETLKNKLRSLQNFFAENKVHHSKNFGDSVIQNAIQKIIGLLP